MSQIDQSFAAARSLPISVSLDQVEAMIAAFPLPSTTPVWKSTTMKVAAAGAIGTSAFIAFWPTEKEAPTPKYHPQIQVPIEADTPQEEIRKRDIKRDSTQVLDELVPEFKEEKSLNFKQKVLAADTDSLVSAVPIKPVVPVKPTAAVTPVQPVSPKEPETPKGLFDGEGGSEAFEKEHPALFGNTEQEDHDEHEQHESCDCDCTSTDVLEWNKHVDEGVMSFFFSCENDDVQLDKSELKHFEKELTRVLKRHDYYAKEIRIDYPNNATIIINKEKVASSAFYDFQILFQDHEIMPGEKRKILLAKDQIWVGDFEKGEFRGTAKGFNVKKSMADEWLEDFMK